LVAVIKFCCFSHKGMPCCWFLWGRYLYIQMLERSHASIVWYDMIWFMMGDMMHYSLIPRSSSVQAINNYYLQKILVIERTILLISSSLLLIHPFKHIYSLFSHSSESDIVRSTLSLWGAYSGGGSFPHRLNKYATSISLVNGIINFR